MSQARAGSFEVRVTAGTPKCLSSASRQLQQPHAGSVTRTNTNFHVRIRTPSKGRVGAGLASLPVLRCQPHAHLPREQGHGDLGRLQGTAIARRRPKVPPEH